MTQKQTQYKKEKEEGWFQVYEVIDFLNKENIKKLMKHKNYEKLTDLFNKLVISLNKGISIKLHYCEKCDILEITGFGKQGNNFNLTVGNRRDVFGYLNDYNYVCKKCNYYSFDFVYINKPERLLKN